MYAIIDVGSNTIRLNVYSVTKDYFKILFNKKVMAGLAGYVEDNRITQEGIDVACKTLSDFKYIVENFDIGNMLVFATASLRNVDNTDEALAQIYKRTGINVEIVSGEEEAILDFEGATHNLIDMNDGLLVDIGGGSTELVSYVEKKISNAISIPLGSLKLYKKCVDRILPTKSEYEKLVKTSVKEIEKIDEIEKKKYSIICGVGGTIRAVLKLNNCLFKASDNNKIITISNLQKIVESFKKEDFDTINAVLKVCPDRIHTIIPGATLLYNICKYYECDVIMVSNYGVREGYLYSRVINKM